MPSILGWAQANPLVPGGSLTPKPLLLGLRAGFPDAIIAGLPKKMLKRRLDLRLFEAVDLVDADTHDD